MSKTSSLPALGGLGSAAGGLNHYCDLGATQNPNLPQDQLSNYRRQRIEFGVSDAIRNMFAPSVDPVEEELRALCPSLEEATAAASPLPWYLRGWRLAFLKWMARALS